MLNEQHLTSAPSRSDIFSWASNLIAGARGLFKQEELRQSSVASLVNHLRFVENKQIAPFLIC